jgi:hypothetical protein
MPPLRHVLLAVALPPCLLAACLFRAPAITLAVPVDLEVVQRDADGGGVVRLAGRLSGVGVAGTLLEARLAGAAGDAGAWQPIAVQDDGFTAGLRAPAGGWYRLEVRASRTGIVVAEAVVPRVGVGEIFVVAGQSNSANYGESKQAPRSDRVVAWDGGRWQVARDPQPGAGGSGGSFMPPLGDAIVAACNVPVGFVACGLGGTSVREWLPEGERFPDPPTVERRVRRLADGGWESDGRAYATLVAAMKARGPRGFRAVLWHQGESDANQQDPHRTLPGERYRALLETLIRRSRADIGWEADWFVAQATYHVPGDESSPDIRAAQAAVVQDGVALAGPDTDALKGPLRERNGTGVHFSAAGLEAHAAAWAEILVPWLTSR